MNKWSDWIIYGGNMPQLELPTVDKPQMPNSILVIDKQSGCHFVDNVLYHTDDCRCDELHDRSVDESL